MGELTECDRHQGSKCCWKKGAYRLAQCRVATNLQFIKNSISVKHNKAKHSKIGYAYNSRLVKVTFLGEAETAVRLGVKSWFGDVNLSTSDLIFGLFLLLTE